MPQKGSSMRQIREILRLRYELGLLQQDIARSCGISQPTVHRYLERAEAAGLSWPLPQDCDDRRLRELLSHAVVGRDAPGPIAHETETAPPVPQEPARPRAPINFGEIHRELQTHKHLTLQLLWEEYLQSCPDGYRYSQFCELYRQWRRKLDVVLRRWSWLETCVSEQRDHFFSDRWNDFRTVPARQTGRGSSGRSGIVRTGRHGTGLQCACEKRSGSSHEESRECRSENFKARARGILGRLLRLFCRSR